jgi:glycosyltransferase involved in cell wall biosynthesis
MNKPQVSIIIPIYNGHKYLNETIQSVFNQTFKDWELLLIDDGSVDNSIQIAKRYAASYSDKVRYFEHPGHINRGQFASRIFGAKHARANTIALLDQDDFWEINYLEEHLKIWEKYQSKNIALSYGPSLYWYFDNPTHTKDYVQQVPSKEKSIYEPGELLGSFLATHYANTPCPTASLIRRDIFEQVVRFENSAKGSSCEDLYLWWYIGAHFPIAVHSNVWVRYRQHNESALAQGHKSAKKALKTELNFLKEIREYLLTAVPTHPLLVDGTLDNYTNILQKEYTKARLQEYIPASLYNSGLELYRLTRKIVPH